MHVSRRVGLDEISFHPHQLAEGAAAQLGYSGKAKPAEQKMPVLDGQVTRGVAARAAAEESRRKRSRAASEPSTFKWACERAAEERSPAAGPRRQHTPSVEVAVSDSSDRLALHGGR